ncbi:Hsp70 family protein [Mycolicibacterium aubagnense]
MSNGLGLSIGQTNLVAVPAGRPPVSRRAILSLYPDRPAEVGIPTQPGGLVLTGFVERVGDPIPLIAPDGSRIAARPSSPRLSMPWPGP